MLMYAIILFIPIVFSIIQSGNYNKSKVEIFIYCIILVIFIGLRDEVGADWGGYLNIFDLQRMYIGLDGIDLLKTEQLFLIINRVSDAIGFGIYGVNFVCALIFVIGIYTFALTTARPWLAIAMVTPYLSFIIAMSGIRQAAAIGIAFFALARWGTITVPSKLALILLSAEFHTSGMLLIVFMLLEGTGGIWLRTALVGGVSAAVLNISAGQDAIETYNSRYIDNNMISQGSLAHIALSAIPGAAYLLLRRDIARAGWSNRFVAIGSIGALLSVPASFVSSTGADRLALFFSYVQMWTYSALAATFPRYSSQITMMSVAISLTIFVVYFTFGVTVKEFVPYKSIILQ